MLNDKILNNKIKQNINFTLNKDHIFIKKKSLETLLQDNDIKSYLDCNVFSSDYTYKKLIVMILRNEDFTFCKTCKNLLSYNKRYQKYCSDKCMKSDKNLMLRRYQTQKENNLKKYGVENPGQLQSVKDKVKQTCLEKYGVESVLQLEHIKECARKNQIENKNEINEKRKRTCLEKFGCEYSLQSNEIKEKIKQTCLEKYGVDNVWKSEEIKNKIKQTCLEKYGKEYFTQTDEYLNELKDTSLKKYGTEHPLKSDFIKNIIKKTNIEKYGKEYFKIYDSWNHLNSLEYVKPLFTFDEFKGGNKIEYKWKCTKCGHEFYSRYDDGRPICVCPKCKESSYSLKEKELIDFCKHYFLNLECHNRTLIKPLELDIIIEELKLAIEFNGSYWHDVNHVSSGYHLNKVIKCNEKGYRLIHIWEDEWNELTKQKLIDIFECKEIINFSKPLDRSWYNNLDSDFKELQPEIIIRDGFEVENCGYLVYIKN